MLDQQHSFSSQYCSGARSHRGRHEDCTFVFHTFDIGYTNIHSTKAEQQVCSKTPTPEISLKNLRAYGMWILSNSWATGCWRTYAADNVKTVESLRAFEKCLDFMSLNAMTCHCGGIFVRYLFYTCFPKPIRLLASYLGLTIGLKFTNMIYCRQHCKLG